MGRSAYGLARRRLADELCARGIRDARVPVTCMRRPRHAWVCSILRMLSHEAMPPALRARLDRMEIRRAILGRCRCVDLIGEDGWAA